MGVEFSTVGRPQWSAGFVWLGTKDDQSLKAILLDRNDPLSRLENGNIDVLEPIAIEYLCEPSIRGEGDSLAFNGGRTLV